MSDDDSSCLYIYNYLAAVASDLSAYVTHDVDSLIDRRAGGGIVDVPLITTQYHGEQVYMLTLPVNFAASQYICKW